MLSERFKKHAYSFIKWYRRASYILKKLIRIYTPFLMAICSIVYAILYFNEDEGIAMNVLNEINGHSFIALCYIASTYRRMCIWYKCTVIILFPLHIANLCHLFGWFSYDDIHYIALVFGIISFVCFVIFLTTKRIVKVIC